MRSSLVQPQSPGDALLPPQPAPVVGAGVPPAQRETLLPLQHLPLLVGSPRAAAAPVHSHDFNRGYDGRLSQLSPASSSCSEFSRTGTDSHTEETGGGDTSEGAGVGAWAGRDAIVAGDACGVGAAVSGARAQGTEVARDHAGGVPHRGGCGSPSHGIL